MSLRARQAGLLIAGGLAAGCAGYRGGWESIAYIADAPPGAVADSGAPGGARNPPGLRVPGLELRVAIDNQLRTHDTKVYFFALPLSVDPRRVYPKNHQPGRTRVYVTVTPQESGFVFRPADAILHVADRRFAGAAGFEFGMWDDAGQPVERGGKWEHRPVGPEFTLTEAGRRYYLSIDFDTPVPSPESPDIVLDLSRALKSTAGPPLPPIRFAPTRWKEGYS